MKKQIGIYSGLHFLVDFLCAAAMFGRFMHGSTGYVWMVVYNFCAFAIQMPLGIILDELDGRINHKKYSVPIYTMCLGVLLTAAGAFSSPVILGIGNAMFHVGGGVGTIKEDEDGEYCGAGLGVFVAPGALGLYIGTILSKFGWYTLCCLAGISLSGVLVWSLFRYGKESKSVYSEGQSIQKEWDIQKEQLPLRMKDAELWILCLLVVILRSYVGMAVTFPWNTTMTAGIISVFAVVLGKIAGGFVAAKAGIGKAASSSLALAGVLYLFSDTEVAGVLALFFFNMSMPMTLYMLVKKYPNAAGFSFGLLTFGLFLGFLPVFLGIGNVLPGRLTGCAGSVVSLILIYRGVKGCYDCVSG